MKVEALEEMGKGVMLKSDIGAGTLVIRVCEVNNDNSS